MIVFCLAIINSFPKFGFLTVNFLPSDLNHSHTAILWKPECRHLHAYESISSPASYVLPGPPLFLSLEILPLLSSQVLILLPLKCRICSRPSSFCTLYPLCISITLLFQLWPLYFSYLWTLSKPYPYIPLPVGKLNDALCRLGQDPTYFSPLKSDLLPFTYEHEHHCTSPSYQV